MAQFIHLLLLLGMCHVAATYVYERQVWLLEGSTATFPFPKDATIKYCGRGGSKCKCNEGKCESNNSSLPGVTVTNSNLTITNFTRKNDQINLCYDASSGNQCAHLNVSIGCSESHLITFATGQTKHEGTTEADCRRLCTEDPTCQYFTFYTDDKTCSLMTSRDDMLIQLHSNAVSGYPPRDVCVNPSTVPPGPTPTQPSDDAPVNPPSVPPGPTPTQPSDKGEEKVNPSTVPPGPTPTQPSDDAPVNPPSVPPGPTPTQPSDKEEEKGLRFYQDHKSWIRALQHCHSKNSALVQITNQGVQDAVNSFLQNKSGLDRGVWIGLERSIFGGRDVPWQWISGQTVTFNHWNSSSVDPLNNHCGKIIRVKGSQEFKWLDEYCHEELPFIC